MNVVSPILRRRVIEETDLDAVAALLATGFPARTAARWRRGLERLRRRESPSDYPRFGRLLEIEGRVVGALLTIYADMPDEAGHPLVRCNVSSWYVESAFAAHAPLLLGTALRDTRVTIINITPAPHTQAIIEAMGFRSFAEGSLLTIPSLARRRERTLVRAYDPADGRGWADAGLLADHAALDCLCFVVEAADGLHPFVFAPPRPLRRFLPATELLYCRDISDYVRFAGPLGAKLLRHGAGVVLVDGVGRLAGMYGRAFNTSQKKYVVGPNSPRPGDLAYTEYAVFG